MEKATVAYTVDRKGYHLFIEKFPAYVCSQCGEKYLDEKEVEVIQNIIKALDEKLQNASSLPACRLASLYHDSCADPREIP